MKCRRIDKETGNIIWFGVKGTYNDISDTDLVVSENIEASENITVGKTKTSKLRSEFYNENNHHDNYSIQQYAVVDSLTQRLSVLKYELWYDYYNGMPLLDKVRNKGIIDAWVIKKILAHQDVLNIENFKSTQDKWQYECNMTIITKYGEVELSL